MSRRRDLLLCLSCCGNVLRYKDFRIPVEYGKRSCLNCGKKDYVFRVASKLLDPVKVRTFSPDIAAKARIFDEQSDIPKTVADAVSLLSRGERCLTIEQRLAIADIILDLGVDSYSSSDIGSISLDSSVISNRN